MRAQHREHARALHDAPKPGEQPHRSRFWSTEIGAFLQPDAFQYLGRTGTLWSWPGQNPIRWRDPYGEGPIDDLQEGLDMLSSLPLVGFIFRGPASFGHGVRNRVHGTLMMSSEGTFDQGECLRGLGNAQIALGATLTAIAATVAVGVAEAAAPLANMPRADVRQLVEAMNRRKGVVAEFATGDAEAYLRAMGAEGSHTLLAGGESHILLRADVASRRTALHEWTHRALQRRAGGPRLGEDEFIEDFLTRHRRLFGLD